MPSNLDLGLSFRNIFFLAAVFLLECGNVVDNMEKYQRQYTDNFTAFH